MVMIFLNKYFIEQTPKLDINKDPNHYRAKNIEFKHLQATIQSGTNWKDATGIMSTGRSNKCQLTKPK